MTSLRDKTVKAIIWNMGGTIFNQVFVIITAVLLTRILDKDDFGLITMVMVFTGLAGILNNFGFSGALVQRKDITEKHKSSVFWINISIGVFLTLLFILLAPAISVFYGDERLTLITRILSLSFLLSSLNLVQFSLVSRRIDFKTISKIRVISSFLSGILAIILAYSGFGYWSLVAQVLFGNVLSTCSYWLISNWRPKFIFDQASVRELLSFGANVTLLRILNYIGNKLDSLLIGRVFGADSLGLYNRSQKFQMIPFSVIKSQIASVLFPTFSKLQDDKPKQVDIYLKLTALLSLIIFPVMLGLFAVADEFVIVVLTKKWEAIIPLIQVFCISFLFAGIGFPQITFTANNQTKKLLNISIVIRSMRVIFVIIGVLQGTIFTVALAVGASIIIEQIIMNYQAARVMNIAIWTILKSVWPIFLASIFMAILVMGLDFLFMENLSYFIRLVLKSFSGIIFYCGFLVIFKPNPIPFIFDQYWPIRMNSFKNLLK